MKWQLDKSVIGTNSGTTTRTVEPGDVIQWCIIQTLDAMCYEGFFISVLCHSWMKEALNTFSPLELEADFAIAKGMIHDNKMVTALFKNYRYHFTFNSILI
ncbi:uncharacterized protein LOC112904150 isoform X1 [Agrilus planipennis]|uniref:Uncharacterized protein LOC112904150 isoform X1 n=1 Tax=Agrilus planipennis TaxID=224129 RepID=A0A7F5R218_AGRPL|nr:uncharacterized protein LOC112904150 isoform X1 [Agrilus planipennis]